MQASKCLAAMETQHCSRTTMRACLRTTNDPQTNEHSAAHHGKFSQCSQTPTDKPQDAWTISPCNQTGAAEACAGPESCCGSAAPTASPRTLFQRLLSCVTAHKRLVVLSSRVSSVQNSPDIQTRRARGEYYLPRLARHIRRWLQYMRSYWF